MQRPMEHCNQANTASLASSHQCDYPQNSAAVAATSVPVMPVISGSTGFSAGSVHAPNTVLHHLGLPLVSLSKPSSNPPLRI
jgi:hypothetical protein